MNSKIQVTLNGRKFDTVEINKTIIDFKKSIYNKYHLAAADFYYIDEDGFHNLIDSNKDYQKVVLKKCAKFYVKENIEGSDGSVFTKSDSRNLHFNDEFEDLKNDGKPRNTLVKIKKEKSLIKKKLKGLNRGVKTCTADCPCENNKCLLEQALKDYKDFQKKRLNRKFWKTSPNKLNKNYELISV